MSENAISLDQLNAGAEHLRASIKANADFLQAIGEFATSLSAVLQKHEVDPALHNAIGQVLVTYVGVKHHEIEGIQGQLAYTEGLIASVLAKHAQVMRQMDPNAPRRGDGTDTGRNRIIIPKP